MGFGCLVSLTCDRDDVNDDPGSDCDSPMSLVNMTFDWLKKEWADEVDFVVWTGDNARSVVCFSLWPDQKLIH